MTKRAAEAVPPPLESSRVGPDFFGYYRDQVAELLSKEERIPNHEPSATTSTEAIGAKLSNLKNEKLNALLRQSVWDLVPEIDEMQSRACSMHLMSQLKNKKPSTIPEIPEDPTFKEVEDDIQLLMRSDPTLVKEIVRKLSDDLFTRLDNMEQQLEKLLDNVVTTCRPMSRGEKRDLQKSIKELPRENLVRVAGIIKNRYAALGKEFSDEVVVNMEEEDNIMLWRLHYYVAAVKSAQELSS
ncbi:unnamed protein product [Arabis nemorensis]|uniref:NET domain-containing protein n=1 Tax=Arabis nemorensis TaxID=586526 RepID=A0A565C6Z3_9BRAS|nr:unnamed protein product [Arabis nemorensis]